MVTLIGNRALVCRQCGDGGGVCWHSPKQTVSVELNPTEVARVRARPQRMAPDILAAAMHRQGVDMR